MTPPRPHHLAHAALLLSAFSLQAFSLSSPAPLSPDYQITLRHPSPHPIHVFHTYNRPADKAIDAEGLYLKHSLFQLHANEYKDPATNPDTYAHSWAHFDHDFTTGEIEVEVKITGTPTGITLPLKSCGIYPSNLGIRAEIIDGNTIRFKLNKPAKLAIVPNDREARELSLANPRAHEGYRNPCFLFARAPEQNPPARDAPGTLLIHPGQQYTQAEFAKHHTLYFAAGVHDYSKHNPDDPHHYIALNPGQRMYLETGAYVYGHVKAAPAATTVPGSQLTVHDLQAPGANLPGAAAPTVNRKLETVNCSGSAAAPAQRIARMPLLYGRGTMSGVKNVWTGEPRHTCEVLDVRVEGIQIADFHNHVSHSPAPFIDVAIVGAWHGNTDGLTVEYGRAADDYDGPNIKDCFVMGGDTNLKFRGIARIDNYTIWQLGNAEPVWMAPTDDLHPQTGAVLVENIQIIAYNKTDPRNKANPGQLINVVTEDFVWTKNANGTFKNVTIRNILCDAPFASRLFTFRNHIPNDLPIFENVLFENITINTPVIQMKSVFGKSTPDAAPMGRVTFRNLVINGVKVTPENHADYFTLLEGATVGREIIFE